MAIDTTLEGVTHLDELTEAVRQEIAEFGYPATEWPVRHDDGGGRPVRDVLIVGAGQAGIATAIHLRRDGVRNIELVDAAGSGSEGPWTTWARMETLRTPKTLLGPEAGLRSATFRTWYTHRHGAAAYDALELVPRTTWQEYLSWLRHAVGVPVTNRTTVTTLRPHGPWWEVGLAGPDGPRTVLARTVVACTGMTGAGGARVPAVLDGLAHLRGSRWAHSSDHIDFSALAGRRVAVVGTGASAFDNAAAALERGAAEVVQLGRRPALPTLNPARHLESGGLYRGFSALPDDVRLGFVRREFRLPMPPPAHSVERCERHPHYRLELGAEMVDVTEDGDGLRVATTRGTHHIDFLVAATGFAVDLGRVPWLGDVVDDILLWSDVHALGDDAVDRHIARHPYLGAGMACRPRPGGPAALRHLHLVNEAAHVSAGIIALGINGLPWASEAVAHTVTRDLASADGAALLADFLAGTDEGTTP